MTTSCSKCAGLTGDELKKCQADDANNGGTGGATPASGDPDGLPSGCRDLGVLDESKTVDGSVTGGAASDPADFYCFSLPAISTLTVGLKRTGDLGGFDVTVYPYADSVSRSDAIGSAQTDASWDLLDGRYAFKMASDSLGLGLGYEITFSRTDLGLMQPDPDPGSTTDKAFSLSVSQDLLWTDGYVGSQDASDLYDVVVPDGMVLAMQLENVGSSGAVSAKTAEYAMVGQFGDPVLLASANTSVQTLPKPIASGHWLILVDGSGAYRLGTALETPP